MLKFGLILGEAAYSVLLLDYRYLHQWLLETETTKASFPIVFETILVFNSMTDFTLGGSGGIQLDWFRTIGYTNSHINFPSSERKRTIAIGK